MVVLLSNDPGSMDTMTVGISATLKEIVVHGLRAAWDPRESVLTADG